MRRRNKDWVTGIDQPNGRDSRSYDSAHAHAKTGSIRRRWQTYKPSVCLYADLSDLPCVKTDLFRILSEHHPALDVLLRGRDSRDPRHFHVPVAECVVLQAVAIAPRLELERPVDLDHRPCVTGRDNAIAGGAGAGVAECLAANGVTLPIQHLGLPDVYLDHGSREEVLTMAGLDLPQIRNAIRTRFPQFVDTPVASAG